MNTNDLRNKLEATMNGLMNGTMDSTTAHEISNAAGKFVATLKVDLAGELLRHRLASYSNDNLSLCKPAIEAEKGE